MYEIMSRQGSDSGGIVFILYLRRMRKCVAIKLKKANVKSDFYNRSYEFYPPQCLTLLTIGKIPKWIINSFHPHNPAFHPISLHN